MVFKRYSYLCSTTLALKINGETLEINNSPIKVYLTLFQINSAWSDPHDNHYQPQLLHLLGCAESQD